VAGIAVDMGEEGNGFALTFEIVDLKGHEGGQFGSLLLDTKGETLTEAVYDAYARRHSHVYLGVADVVVISQAVAEQVGVDTLVNYLIRDKNARSNVRILVAGTETARELFDPVEAGDDAEGGSEGPGQGPRVLLSQILSESLSPTRRGISSATDARAAYEVYHILNRGTSDLALPIVGPAEAEDIPFQLDGLALFRGGRMVGTLDEADMPLYLLATTGLRDRIFPVTVEGLTEEEERAVIAVQRSRAQVEFDWVGDVPRFFLDIRIEADVAQPPASWEAMDQTVVRRLERGAEQTLSGQVLELAERLRDGGHDVLGFAEAVRSRDPRLWEQIAGDWQAWLRVSEIDAWVEVRIQNTGLVGG